MTLFEVVVKASLAVPAIHYLGFKGLMLVTLLSGVAVSLLGRLTMVANVSGHSYSVIILRLIKISLPIILVSFFVFLLANIIDKFHLGDMVNKLLILVFQTLILLFFMRDKIRNKLQSKVITVT